MADAENETHSYDLPVLQALPPTHFVNKNACSSQKQQGKPDLQTCLNNSFQLFADTLMSKFENLTNKIKEKSPTKELLLGNDLNDRIGTIETIQKILQTCSNSPY